MAASKKRAGARKTPGVVSKEVFFQPADPVPFQFGDREVFVHEVDADMYVEYIGILAKKPAKSLSDDERSAFLRANDRRSRAFLIVKCVKGADGQRIFTDQDIDRVDKEMRPHVFIQLSSIAMSLTGLLDGVGAAEKN